LVLADVSAEVVLKNESVAKLADLQQLVSLDLSADNVSAKGEQQSLRAILALSW
jgi:hypothetical protein